MLYDKTTLKVAHAARVTRVGPIFVGADRQNTLPVAGVRVGPSSVSSRYSDFSGPAALLFCEDGVSKWFKRLMVNSLKSRATPCG